MKIIVNESQLKFLNEDLVSQENISYEYKTSIAIWCLLNDFRYIVPDSVFGRKTSLANSEPINKEICTDIMNGNITVANEEKELFGYNDYDDFENSDDEREEYMNGYTIYKVETEKESYYIEVSDDISEYYGDMTIQEFEDGEIDEYDMRYELIKWFYNTYI